MTGSAIASLDAGMCSVAIMARMSRADAGHVFIVRADLARLGSDAWLLPCDEGLRVSESWKQRLERERPELLCGSRLAKPAPAGWGTGGRRTYRIGRWPGQSSTWAALTGYPWEEPEWFVEGARQFVRATAGKIGGSSSLHGRAKPLLALPVPGIGEGGGRERTGEIIESLLDALENEAVELDVDIALVLRDRYDHAAAQSVRRRRLARRRVESRETWSIPQPLLDAAVRLGRQAATGSLVLFLGAGISQEAGLPGWGALIEGLARDARMPTEEIAALKRLDVLDQAQLVEGRLGDLGGIGAAVSARLSTPTYSLAHALLASLPIREAATTNYDALFERAAESIHSDFAVLPYHPARDRERWLLKLHGDVDHPEDIVLTREHYLRYSEQRAALAGIVQALLVTRHMLFVGFSLSDDNFHRIVTDVRKALPPSSEGTFGTALFLERDPLLEELWSRDVEVLAASTGEGGQDTANARRSVELFLDLLLHEATDDSAFLLERRFEHLLLPEERELAAKLTAPIEETPDAARRTRAWSTLLAAFGQLGLPGAGEHRSRGTR